MIFKTILNWPQHTLSGYIKITSFTGNAYLKVKTADGTTYASDAVTGSTDAEFNDGWQRETVTFTLRLLPLQISALRQMEALEKPYKISLQNL